MAKPKSKKAAENPCTGCRGTGKVEDVVMGEWEECTCSQCGGTGVNPYS